MGLHFKFCLGYETEPPTSLGVCEGTRLPPSAMRCLPQGAALERPRTLGEGGALTCLKLRSGERLLFADRASGDIPQVCRAEQEEQPEQRGRPLSLSQCW